MFLLYFWYRKEIIGHCSKIATTIDLPNSQLQHTWFSRLPQLYCSWPPDVKLCLPNSALAYLEAYLPT